MFEIRHYRNAQGRTPFTDWFSGLRDRQTVIVLLCGGDKRKQDADIGKAVELWQEFVERKRSEPRAKR